jgi:hypothetical protein
VEDEEEERVVEDDGDEVEDVDDDGRRSGDRLTSDHVQISPVFADVGLPSTLRFTIVLAGFCRDLVSRRKHHVRHKFVTPNYFVFLATVVTPKVFALSDPLPSVARINAAVNRVERDATRLTSYHHHPRLRRVASPWIQPTLTRMSLLSLRILDLMTAAVRVSSSTLRRMRIAV